MNCMSATLRLTVTAIVILLCSGTSQVELMSTMIPVINAAITTSAFLRFVVPNLPTSAWTSHNQQLTELLQPLHHALAVGDMLPHEAGDCFNLALFDFLKDKPEFVELPKDNTTYCRRENKTLDEARICKNKLRKKAFNKWSTTEDRQNFYQALHTYDFLKKESEKNTTIHCTKYEEKKYRTDFWNFSKKLVNGLLYDTPKHPTFDKTQADTFFQQKYNRSTQLNHSDLNWFPHLPVEQNNHTFSMDPIKPKEIKSILKHKTSNSAPGPDRITYGILKKLPTTHHFMATLFNKITSHGLPPSSWCNSNIILLHKKGDTDIPSNFRMIALASCVGKLYHQIFADRFDSYLVNNQLINTTF